jgi:hypothetical protein
MKFAMDRVLFPLVTVLALAACDDSASVQKLSRSADAPVASDPSAPSTPAPAPVPTVPATPGTPIAGELFTGPAELAKYVQRFADDAQAQGNDVSARLSPDLQIQFGSLDAYGSGVIGLCETSGSMRQVTFDPDFWDQVSETQRQLLVHHELGHCVLYRAHRSELLSSGAYASIMYPIILSSATYTANPAYYLNELFTWSSASDVDPNASTIHICGPGDL